MKEIQRIKALKTKAEVSALLIPNYVDQNQTDIRYQCVSQTESFGAIESSQNSCRTSIIKHATKSIKPSIHAFYA